VSTKLQSVRSVDEFRRLYYPAGDPDLEYFDGVGPDGGDEDTKSLDDPAVADPLDRFSRSIKALERRR